MAVFKATRACVTHRAFVDASPSPLPLGLSLAEAWKPCSMCRSHWSSPGLCIIAVILLVTFHLEGSARLLMDHAPDRLPPARIRRQEFADLRQLLHFTNPTSLRVGWRSRPSCDTPSRMHDIHKTACFASRSMKSTYSYIRQLRVTRRRVATIHACVLNIDPFQGRRFPACKGQSDAGQRCARIPSSVRIKPVIEAMFVARSKLAAGASSQQRPHT